MGPAPRPTARWIGLVLPDFRHGDDACSDGLTISPAREYGRLSVRSETMAPMAAGHEVTLVAGLPAAPVLPSAALARLPETAGSKQVGFARRTVAS